MLESMFYSVIMNCWAFLLVRPLLIKTSKSKWMHFKIPDFVNEVSSNIEILKIDEKYFKAASKARPFYEKQYFGLLRTLAPQL